MNVKSLMAFFIGGMFYALIALSKNMISGESFDPSKLVKTTLLAGLLAVFSAFTGAEDLSEIDLVVQGAGETVLLDKALKALRSALRKAPREKWLG